MEKPNLEINGKKYREMRCYKCRKLFGYEYVREGRIAIFCERCGELFTINFYDIHDIKKKKNLPGFKNSPAQK